VKVRLSRSGGFTGIRRSYELSDEALAPADAARLREAVARARSAAARAAAPAPGADRFRYELSVDDGAAPLRVQGESGEELSALAELMEELGGG
jgi:emfourin